MTFESSAYTISLSFKDTKIFSALSFRLGTLPSTLACFPNCELQGAEMGGVGWGGGCLCPFLPRRFLGSLCKFIYPFPKLCTPKARAT